MGGGPAAFFANGCEAPAARHRSPAAPAQHRSLQPAEPAPGNLSWRVLSSSSNSLVVIRVLRGVVCLTYHFQRGLGELC